jgi:N-acetylmuramoyl-L-alanine amidase
MRLAVACALVCVGMTDAYAQTAPAPNGWTTEPAAPPPARPGTARPTGALRGTQPPSTAPSAAEAAAELASGGGLPDIAAGAAPPVKAGRTKPVIVIDPGHGGIDPGAVGPGAGGGQVLEKHVVLAVARQLGGVLLASGRYEVVLTRSGDTFVPLDQRLRQSLRLKADLFISIHADSVAENVDAQTVRGASIYTLSDQASDEQARQLAEKENAADAVAGVIAAADSDQDQVRNILVDLMKRETASYSADFRALASTELGRRIAMAREPQRSAAFRVLKQTEVPSVLIELGYMSNAQDQKFLQSAAWQAQVAGSIKAAVDRFFAPRLTAGKP